MPFAIDMNWSQSLLSIFNIGHNKKAPLESHYYGHCDSLINYAMCEGSNFKFFLAPQTTRDVIPWTLLYLWRFESAARTSSHRGD
jgi:hypothetical protein